MKKKHEVTLDQLELNKIIMDKFGVPEGYWKIYYNWKKGFHIWKFKEVKLK